MNCTNKDIQTVYLGGGCFWCLEGAFGIVDDIISVSPGYMGGVELNPNYETVCSGKTGHAEVVKIDFFNQKLPLEDLLKIFFNIHDPTTLNKQGMDIGSQYRSIIICENNFQYNKVKKFISELNKSKIFNNAIVTDVYSQEQEEISEEKKVFWEAETEHKKYFKNNPNSPYCKAVIIPKIEKTKSLIDSKKNTI